MKKTREPQNSLLENKPILVIETSAGQCGICVYFSETKYAKFALVEERGHSKKIAGLVANALELYGIKPENLVRVVVSGGPGSFTGLRIGFSMAKGLSIGKNIPFTKINTLDAIAFELIPMLSEGDFCHIFMKINKKELYYRKFQKSGNFYKFISDLQIIENEQAEKLVEKDAFVTGNFNPGSARFVKKDFPDPVSLAQLVLYPGYKVSDDDEFAEPDYIKEFQIMRKT